MERLGFTLLSSSRNPEWRHTAIFSPAPGMHIFWRAELSLQLPLWYFSLEKQLSPVTVVSVVSAVPTQEVGTYSLCELKKEKKYFMLNCLGRSALSNHSLLAFLLLFFFNTFFLTLTVYYKDGLCMCYMHEFSPKVLSFYADFSWSFLQISPLTNNS